MGKVHVLGWDISILYYLLDLYDADFSTNRGLSVEVICALVEYYISSFVGDVTLYKSIISLECCFHDVVMPVERAHLLWL